MEGSAGTLGGDARLLTSLSQPQLNVNPCRLILQKRIMPQRLEGRGQAGRGVISNVQKNEQISYMRDLIQTHDGFFS